MLTRSFAGFAALASLGQFLNSALAQGEQSGEIIAAHIRQQGFRCESPVSAQHEVQVSRPNEQVWLLRCANGAYRVTLVPDLQARVEPLN